jgi:hypothetical protein
MNNKKKFNENGELLCKCGKYLANPPHPCPYQQEIASNDDPEYCTCCSDCKAECYYNI